MHILNDDETLSQYLSEVKDQNIYIVSAFANGTEDIIKKLIDQNKHVELIIGTINAFSDINFIDFCVEQAKNNKNFDFYVDFRYENSVHWKLYTVSPNLIIIGSANLTIKGLSLSRDTCISVKNQILYNDYLKKIDELKNIPEVVNSKSSDFSKKLKKYKEVHKKTASCHIYNFPELSLKEWLNSEHCYDLPLFIWDSYLSEDQVDYITTEVEQISPNQKFDPDKQCLLIDGEDKEDYPQGCIILAMNKNGNYISFFKCDVIIPDSSSTDLFLIDFSETTKDPFKLEPNIKRNLKKKASKWYSNDKHQLSRKDLKELIE